MNLARLFAAILIVFGLNTTVKAQDERIIQFAQQEITSYISLRPDAADTLEGIHNWWINWPGLPASSVITRMALERLEAAGILERIRVGNSVLWRSNRFTLN